MTRRATIKIEVDAGGRGSIYIDDMDVSHLVTGIDFTANVGEVTEVTLRMIGAKLDVETDADLKTVVERAA